MAKTKIQIVFGASNFTVPAGEEMELISTPDNGFSTFEARWKTGNNQVTGTVLSQNLEFTPEEISEAGFSLDSKGLPIYRNLEVIYIGQSTAAVQTNATLIVREPWYNGYQTECECLHLGNAPVNTNGRVVVKCSELVRR